MRRSFDVSGLYSLDPKKLRLIILCALVLPDFNNRMFILNLEAIDQLSVNCLKLYFLSLFSYRSKSDNLLENKLSVFNRQFLLEKYSNSSVCDGLSKWCAGPHF